MGNLVPSQSNLWRIKTSVLVEEQAKDFACLGFPQEIYKRFGALDVALERPETHTLIFDTEGIGQAEALKTPGRYGKLAVHCGFVLPDEEPRKNADVHNSEQATDG